MRKELLYLESNRLRQSWGMVLTRSWNTRTCTSFNETSKKLLWNLKKVLLYMNGFECLESASKGDYTGRQYERTQKRVGQINRERVHEQRVIGMDQNIPSNIHIQWLWMLREYKGNGPVTLTRLTPPNGITSCCCFSPTGLKGPLVQLCWEFLVFL